MYVNIYKRNYFLTTVLPPTGRGLSAGWEYDKIQKQQPATTAAVGDDTAAIVIL
jgi:hypothetical protein